jgi:prepilin-type N-terminal cleavage/methylation domain-containing protein
VTDDAALEPQRGDRGFTLVEVLVAMGLFGLLSTLLLGFALSTGQVEEDTRKLSGVNEESRLAMERMSRELRQANAVISYTPAASTGAATALTFWTDFDGDGIQDLSVTDPEVLSYRWDPTTERLTLTANDEDGTAVTRPVLASNVSALSLQLYSSRWEYDTTTNDGEPTKWTQIDAAGAPVGDNDGVPDARELELIDLVKVSMTVLDGSHRQTYQSQIDLRNRNQN